MHIYLSHQGDEVVLHTDEVVRGSRYVFRVVWTNRWDLLDALVTADRLERIHCGPATFGHCEYVYP